MNQIGPWGPSVLQVPVLQQATLRQKPVQWLLLFDPGTVLPGDISKTEMGMSLALALRCY